jgi:alpha-methylacyl-CoA racemase
MLLADLGADVLRVARPGVAPARFSLPSLDRGKSTLELDLRSEEGRDRALTIVARCDVVIEGFRPGVMERLGLGPDDCLIRNSRLIYGRMTGWGQDGPLAKSAGHDLNYIAISGALAAIGTKEAPVPPLNLVGDFGGALYLAIGILAALNEAQRSGLGQVVDAAMADSTAHLMTAFYSLHAEGQWSLERAANFCDGGAPFYQCYRTADGRWLSVAAIEPQFYAALVAELGLTEVMPADRQWNEADWPSHRSTLAGAIGALPLQQLVDRFAGKDACVAPVLTMAEAPTHPHNAARRTFVDLDGAPRPAPAPRFSRSSTDPARANKGADAPSDVLQRWGVD